MAEQRDFIIIGGGPAGLSAAQYGARSNLNVTVFEEMASGGQMLIIDDMENYPGIPEPIKGFDFSQQMEKQAKKFGAEIIISSVKELHKNDHLFTIETAKGTFTAPTVLIATGAKHKHLNVPGEREFAGRGVSYCATCDGPFFKNKKILVVGGGDSACDEASFLANLSENIVHIHRRNRFRAQKALGERVIKNPNIDVRFNTVLKEIKGEQKVSKVLLARTDKEEQYEETMDAVFIFIGSIPQTQLVPDIPKDDGGYIVTNQYMETSIPGLYAAGDVRNTPYRQVVVAAADGAIAAHSASAYIDELRGEAYT
jgi:thioredoxin reductase (NADPH)